MLPAWSVVARSATDRASARIASLTVDQELDGAGEGAVGARQVELSQLCQGVEVGKACVADLGVCQEESFEPGQACQVSQSFVSYVGAAEGERSEVG